MITEKQYNEAKELVSKYEQLRRQETVETIKINLNDSCLVNLTETGLNYLLEKRNQHMPPQFMISMETLRSKIDKNGYMEFQIWDFMKLFGHTIGTSMNLFSLNIKLYK